MKRFLALAVLPALGLLLIFLGLSLSGSSLLLRLTGTAVPGELVGLLLVRSGHVDLLTDLSYEAHLTRADGRTLVLRYQNDCPDPANPPVEASLSDLRESIRGGDLEAVRRALRGEQRRADPARVLHLDLRETARGAIGLPRVHPALALVDGRVVPADPTGGRPVFGEIVTRVRFDLSDPQRLQDAKGDALVGFSRTRAGLPEEPVRRNFALFAEPYATEFRPVFRYTAGGTCWVRVSPIGRQGGPTLALRLFRSCRVYHHPERPAEALLVADPGSPDGAWLTWFSRVCEGIFSQWGAPVLILLAGAISLAVGLLQASLAVWPAFRVRPPPSPPRLPIPSP